MTDNFIEQWSEREVEVFRKKLSKQIDLLLNPGWVPVSLHNPKPLKAV